MKPALLVLDPQNDFFEEDNPNLAAFRATIPVINSASAFFRERRWPVLFVQHISHDKPAGSHAWAIHAGFDCTAQDIQFSKTHPNAFWQTELDTLLKSRQVDFVVLAGYLAEQCVLATLRAALEHAYRGAILENSIASLDDRHTRFVLEISPHISLDEWKADAD